jgi:Lsr2
LRGWTVQLTIDSAEPLEKVLAAIGALYNVEVATPAPPVAKKATRVRVTGPATRQNSPATHGPRSRKASTRPSRRASVAKPDPASVRAWAKTTGLEVNDRGRVPASVTAAYVAAGAPTD